MVNKSVSLQVLYYTNFMLVFAAVSIYFSFFVGFAIFLLYQSIYWIYLIKTRRITFIVFNILLWFYLDFTVLAKYGPFDIYLLEAIGVDRIFFKAFGLSLLSLLLVNLFNLPYRVGSVVAHTDRVRMHVLALKLVVVTYLISVLALGVFGFHLYGGYLAYLSTPYDPVFEGAAENDYKHVIVATAGLMSVLLFAFALALQKHGLRSWWLFVAKYVPIFLVLSYFVQGKREYLVEVLVVFAVFHLSLMSHEQWRKHLLKIFIGLLLLPIFMGVGLYVRGDVTVEDIFSLFQLPLLALGYEAEFTFATLANSLFIKDMYGVGYDYLKVLYDILVYLVPRDVFNLFGINKDDLFLVSKFAGYYVENKGGAFYLVTPFTSFGYFGVIAFSIFLGGIFYVAEGGRKAAVASRVFYALFVMSIFVLMRKDFALWFKYIYVWLIQPAVIYFVARELIKALSRPTITNKRANSGV